MATNQVSPAKSTCAINKAAQMDFTDKRVWVTGAGQGIGYQIASQFVALGADVVGLDKSFSATQNFPFTTALLDISNPQQVALVCQHLLSQVPRIDVLVNGAGILRMAETEALSLEDWQQCFNVNVSGAFYLLRQLIPQFKWQRFGAVVTIGSNAAHVPRIQMSAYCASKAALTSLSHCVGLELAAYGVRCNVVSPALLIPRCSAACGTVKMRSSGRLPVFHSNINWVSHWGKSPPRRKLPTPWCFSPRI